MKLKKLAHLIALIGAVSPAVAQTNTEPPMARVEITGSSIKRIAKEGALPVQVITFDQMEKKGITNAEQLLQQISSNGTGADSQVSGNNVFGADADRTSGGGSFASLRGLGPNSTLVLLNGRRIATYGGSGKAVDLNSIPLGAIARVEILKDGASAIYGTDAVGGVINFILKTNYNGLELSASTNQTEAGGGAIHRLSLLGGTGNLDEQHYNIMGSLTLDRSERLDSSQRSFANGYQPSRGLSPDTTGTPSANQLSGAGTALGTNFTMPGDANKYLQAGLLSLQGKCDTVPGMSQYNTALWKDVTSPLRSTYSCAYDYGGDYVIQVPVERANGLLRGTWQFNQDHRAFVEVLASRTKAMSILTPAQISTTLAAGNAYPVGGPYYQDLSPYISTYDKTKPIIYKWRADPVGSRTQQSVSDNARVLVGFEGTLAGKYDYRVGMSHAESQTKVSLLDGYSYTSKLNAALGTGVINPFIQAGQEQSPAAAALIESTKFRGQLNHGKTGLNQVDGNLSGELFNLPAGAVAGAVGFDLRRETYTYAQDVDATQILLAPGNAGLNKATRDIKAVYAELIVPVVKDLELQLAVRRDQYSVIGATTNPKVAFRYQPAEWLLFRGSANKGFLAPSFVQLYSAQLLQELPNGIIDPVGCPTHPGDPLYCAIPRLPYFTGGNSDLKPETSKQGTLGFVIEPVKGWSASVDYWAINSKNRILNRTPQIVLANATALTGNIIRDPNTGVIQYVTAGWINAAGSKTHGADIGLRGQGMVLDGYKWEATVDGTWTQSFKFAEIAGQEYKEYVGNFYTRDLYLRWKANATLSLSKGDWSGLLSGRYASGYRDEIPDGGKLLPPGFATRVDDYITFGLSATYTGFPHISLTAGIQNLFDKNPPFTAHNVDTVVGAGWDPRVADPRGRAYTLLAKYTF
ncbi:MAG: TonB-dependent receptor [Pseudomonadota bacterium]|nr:TonB-dependent receptor [Pseudomonadota bacterium]